MRSMLTRLACVLCLFQAVSAWAATETVKYPDLSGFDSITYQSEFFGHQSGVNRDFANYVRSFAEPVSQSIEWKNVQVTFADVSGLGIGNLVTYAPETYEFTWTVGNGDGTFEMLRTGKACTHRDGILLAGDLDGDGRPDLSVVRGNEIYMSKGGKEGPGEIATYTIKRPAGQLAAGDFDGDGRADICAYTSGSLSIMHSKAGGGFGEAKASSWRPGDIGGTLVAADFNGDNYCDIALYGSNACPNGFAFWFGRGNGAFGPTEAEERAADHRATHLKAAFEWPVEGKAIPVAGQIDDDGTGDIGLYFPDKGVLLTRLHSGEPAYDYSVHLVKDGPRYKMWHGGRWRTLGEDGNVVPHGDGDHVLTAWSKDGRRWFRDIEKAAFLKGAEEGLDPKEWWSNNYLEPEVVKVNGTYHMFWQVEIDKGQKLDTGETAERQCDRIGLSTSTDGTNWKRKTDRGVVINIPNSTNTNLDHHEVIYVPDDKDGRPWWLYTFHFVDGATAGHVRIRSADPTTFDWNLREPTGLSQIGNQIGYADEAPGGRIFFRITFTGNSEARTVPTFQLSRDGLNWVTAAKDGQARPQLAGSTDNKNNKNVYFLGMSTIDGTGRMEYLGDGRFHLIYGACTSNGPGHDHIWLSEIGVGEAFIRFD